MNERWILAIFEKMRSRYPGQWESKIGDTKRKTDKSMAAWAEVLYDLTEDEIRRGFKVIDDTIPKYPPSVMEFKALCRPSGIKTAAHRRWLALPRPKADRETAMAAISEMRDRMRARPENPVDESQKSTTIEGEL